MRRQTQLKPPRAERGVVLILAIVVLVAMSLAALALMRSVTTGNKVAGNLAFQQSATASADVGVETAVTWLEQNRIGSTLFANTASASAGATTAGGYVAARSDPTGNDWAAWWAALPANRLNSLPADAAGNAVQYVIHRLCDKVGDPATNIGCQTLPTLDPSPGGSKGAGGGGPVIAAPQYYYRITSRVAGARGTVSFVQVVVAM